MSVKISFLFTFSAFFFLNATFSQILTTDTIAIRYYVKYQLDEATKKKNGSYEMIYKDKVLTRGQYKNDSREGKWEFIGNNDTLQQTGSYVDGYKDGIWKFYFADGKPSCDMSYKSGKKDGLFKGFYKNGNVSFEINYVNDKRQGVASDYYENGKLSETETFIDDTLNGLSKRYYESGTLKEQKYKKGDVRDSIYLFYYEDGTLWEHIIYKNGSPYNVIAYNSVDGKPLDCCTIKDGTGIMRFFDKEGRMTDETTYLNSKRNGRSKDIDKGKILEEGNYVDDKKDGIWIDNYSSGELYSKMNYINDEKEGTGNFYYKSGAVSQEGKYVKGKKSGVWVNYEENGKIASEINYVDDRMEGEAKYYEKGKLVCEGKHNKGIRIFNWTFYYPNGKVSYVYDYGYTFVSKDAYKKSFDDTPVKNLDVPYTIVELMPSFPGGETMMMEFIQKNITYPKSAKENNMSGTVYVNFVVDNTGEVIKVNIIRGVVKALDDEAKRIVESMPRWSPGMQSGRPVAVSFNLPIKYRLK